MDFETYKIEFETKASILGYSQENIFKCLRYAEPLIEKKIPIIYNTSHLSALVGYNKRFLKRAVIYTSYFYRDFEILKKNGTKRQISEPLPSLKEIQTWILKNILEKVKVSAFAKAYKKKITIIENVRLHQNKKTVVNYDIVNFFPSITIKEIDKIFKSLGYSELISNLLAKLCSRNNALPQGAPTSPYLSNIFFHQIDDEIANYCLDRDIRYTRFADDLTFSGDFDVIELDEFLRLTLSNFNLSVNEQKKKILNKNQRQIVTGVVVNEKLQVPFYKRNKLRQELFYIKKLGIESHKKNLNIKSKNYISHLLGRINFILHINPTDIEFINYKKVLIDLKKTHPNL